MNQDNMFKTIVVVTLALLVCNKSIYAKDNASYKDSPSNQKIYSNNINKLVHQYQEEHFFNGIYKFSFPGQEICKGSKGITNIRDGALIGHDQVMPLASATKTVTAAAILRLVDRGLLDLKATVSTYLKEGDKSVWTNGIMPSWAEKITIHNLLTHTSGLPGYFLDMQINVHQDHDQINRDIMDFVTKKGLNSEPSSKFEYINTNFVVLGMIIEVVTDVKLSKFLQDEFFTPLGLDSMKMMDLEEAIEIQKDPAKYNFAERYFVIPTNKHHKPLFTAAGDKKIMVPFADGGIIANADDLTKWLRALHSGKVLSEKMYKLMITPYVESHKPSIGIKDYSGYGIFISELKNGEKIYHHPGRAMAIRSESGYSPDSKLIYVILSNCMQHVPNSIKDKIDFSNKANRLNINNFANFILENYNIMN